MSGSRIKKLEKDIENTKKARQKLIDQSFAFHKKIQGKIDTHKEQVRLLRKAEVKFSTDNHACIALEERKMQRLKDELQKVLETAASEGSKNPKRKDLTLEDLYL